MKELLTINIDITGAQSVQGHTGIANMILFSGDCDCDLFKGKILPGGVDTQSAWKDHPYMLSARYIMEGIDCDNKPCRMFIENNGFPKEGEITTTTPKILTDSDALSYLENTTLSGTITPKENGVVIHIFG